MLFAPFGVASWAFLNLIFAGLGVALALYGAVRSLAAKRRVAKAVPDIAATWDDDGDAGDGGTAWLAALMAMGIAGAFLFALTQDMAATLVVIDIWTAVHAAILAVELLALGAVSRGLKKALP